MKTSREFVGRNLVLTLALVLVWHSVAHAQATKSPQQVQVVNTPAQPVPTAAQGTTAIQGEVSVTNFPATTSVNVTNSPTVIVGNDTAAAVPVRDVESARKQPFAFLGSSVWIADAPNTQMFFNVPAGKRLVIEQVAVKAQVNGTAGQKVRVEVTTEVGGTFAMYYMAGTDAGIAGLYEVFVASSQMRMYADPETHASVLVARSDTSAEAHVAVISVSGYLVDVP